MQWIQLGQVSKSKLYHVKIYKESEVKGKDVPWFDKSKSKTDLGNYGYNYGYNAKLMLKQYMQTLEQYTKTMISLILFVF